MINTVNKIIICIYLASIIISLYPTQVVDAYDGNEDHFGFSTPGTIYSNNSFYIYVWLDADNRTGSAYLTNISFSMGNVTNIYYNDASYFFESIGMFADMGSINNASGYLGPVNIGNDNFAGVGNGKIDNDTMIRLTMVTSSPGTLYMNFTGICSAYDEMGDPMGCTRHNNSFVVEEAPEVPPPLPPTNLVITNYSTYLHVSWTPGVNATKTYAEWSASDLESGGGGWTREEGTFWFNSTVATTSNDLTTACGGTKRYIKLWSWNESYGGYSETGIDGDGTTLACGGNSDPDTPILISPIPSLFNDNRTSVTMTCYISDPDEDDMQVTFWIWNHNTSQWDNKSYQTGLTDGQVSYTFTNLTFYSHYNQNYEGEPTDDWDRTFTLQISCWDDNGSSEVNLDNPVYVALYNEVINYAPNQPGWPHPANGSTDRPHLVNLSCIVTDPDDDNLEVIFVNANTSQRLNPMEGYGVYLDEVSSGGRAYMWYNIPVNTTFYWYAKCWDGTTWSNNSDTWQFTTSPVTPGDDAPNYPELLSPFDGQTSVTNNPTLGVRISHGSLYPAILRVVFYNYNGGSPIQIGTSQQFVVNLGSEETAYQKWENLDNDTTYNWYVTVTDVWTGISVITNGGYWSFTTGRGTSYHIQWTVCNIDVNGDMNPLSGVTVEYRSSYWGAVLGSGSTDNDGHVFLTTGATGPTVYYFDFTPPVGYVGKYYIQKMVYPGIEQDYTILLDKVGEASVILVQIKAYDPFHGIEINNLTANVTSTSLYPPMGITYNLDKSLVFMGYYDYPEIPDSIMVILNKSGYKNVTEEVLLTGTDWDYYPRVIFMYPSGYTMSGGDNGTFNFDLTDPLGHLKGVFEMIFGESIGATIGVLIIIGMVLFISFSKLHDINISAGIAFVVGLIFVLAFNIDWYVIILPLLIVIVPLAGKLAGTFTRGNHGGDTG